MTQLIISWLIVFLSLRSDHFIIVWSNRQSMSNKSRILAKFLHIFLLFLHVDRWVLLTNNALSRKSTSPHPLPLASSIIELTQLRSYYRTIQSSYSWYVACVQNLLWCGFLPWYFLAIMIGMFTLWDLEVIYLLFGKWDGLYRVVLPLWEDRDSSRHC